MTPAPDPRPLLAQMAAVRSLPVLTEHAWVLEAVLADPSARVTDLQRVVETDPCLAANLLADANRRSRAPETASIPDALRVLDRDRIRRLASGWEVVRGLGAPPLLDLPSIWNHAVNVALIARQIAPFEGVDPERAYLAGLLHDVGIVALTRFLPQTLARLLADPEFKNLHVALQARYGCLPAALTAHLLATMRLPTPVVQAIESLPDAVPLADPTVTRLRATVHHAHRECEAHGGASPWDTLPAIRAGQLPGGMSPDHSGLAGPTTHHC